MLERYHHEEIVCMLVDEEVYVIYEYKNNMWQFLQMITNKKQRNIKQNGGSFVLLFFVVFCCVFTRVLQLYVQCTGMEPGLSANNLFSLIGVIKCDKSATCCGLTHRKIASDSTGII